MDPAQRGRRRTGRCAGPVRSRRQRRDLDETGGPTTAPRSPRERAAVDEILGGGITAAVAETGSEITTRGVPRHNPAGSGPAAGGGLERQTIDHAARREPAGGPVRTGTPRAPTPGRCSRSSLHDGAQRHGAAGLHAVRLGARRCRAPRRSPSPQSAWTTVPPGVHASTWAATGPARRRAREPGRARPPRPPACPPRPTSPRALDAGRQETKSLDDVAHGLFELGPVASGRRRPGPGGAADGRGARSDCRRRAGERIDSAEAPGWYGP